MVRFAAEMLINFHNHLRIFLFVDGLHDRWPEELLVKGAQRLVQHFATDGHPW